MRKTTIEQATSSHFLRDARNRGADYREEKGLKRSELHDHLIDVYCHLKEPITRYCHALMGEREVWLDTDALEVPGIEDWLDYFFTRAPDHINPYVTIETIDRVIVITSILRAADPQGTAHWGERDE